MKKWEYKEMDITQNLVGDLNREGQAGWQAIHPFGTPAGMKFILAREMDDNVELSDIEAAQKAAKDAELMAKFGLGSVAGPPPGGGLIRR